MPHFWTTFQFIAQKYFIFYVIKEIKKKTFAFFYRQYIKNINNGSMFSFNSNNYSDDFDSRKNYFRFTNECTQFRIHSWFIDAIISKNIVYKQKKEKKPLYIIS